MMPAAGAAGRAKATSSPTTAPVTAIVRSACETAAIDGKSSAADAVRNLVSVAPVVIAPVVVLVVMIWKPFSERTGPEKVVLAIL
jgi:NAD-dependent oxidoreductase involved in siderophore biosynthesis